jgi:energy-coupling factor transporter ATP-binding protein EcfA2
MTGPVMLLQKRILDWSQGLPEWQRDLLRRLAHGPLDEAGRREVMLIMSQSPDAPAPIPLQLADLPADAGQQGRVELRAVRRLVNINRLAPEQSLGLQPGLNVVFGDNGAGKSGYGRLARRVTRSGEPEEILRDVFDPGPTNGRQTATFDIAVDDTTDTIEVDLGADPPQVLSAITAFDASRARVCLTKPNVIEHIPAPLRLLTLLSETQDDLARRLREHGDRIRSGLPALPQLASGTTAATALVGLTDTTDVHALIEQLRLGEKDTAELERAEKAATAIAADQTNQLEASARTQAAAARAAAEKLRAADRAAPVETVGRLADLRGQLDAVVVAERKVADEAFDDQRLEGTGQDAWREMWLAARRFADATGLAFPDAGAPCPVCQQDLEPAAAQRFQRFDQFVSSDLRRKATELQTAIQRITDGLPDTVVLRTAIEAELRAAPEAVVAAAHAAVGVLERRCSTARAIAAGPPSTPEDTPIELTAITAHAETQEEQAKRHAALRNEDQQRAVIRTRDELRARAVVIAAEADLRARIQGLGRLARLDRAIAALNTQRISTKLRELQQLAITERLRKAIELELSELHPAITGVEITGQASKGQTLIQLALKIEGKTKLTQVLSDGEQRALALAFFLAEISVSEEHSAIVLDDPVSSLDDDRREYLARRLVIESQHRQVVILTHDMVFVHQLHQAAEDAGVDIHGCTVQRAFAQIGVVSDGLPHKMLGPAKQINQLTHRLKHVLRPKHQHGDPLYEQEADRWVLDLRKAYDHVIESTMLNGAVRRFSTHVRVRNLHEIQWTQDRAKRIDAAMKQASPKAHHEALALQPSPHKPDELQAMLDELTGLYAEMKGKPDTQPATPIAPHEVVPSIRALQRNS